MQAVNIMAAGAKVSAPNLGKIEKFPVVRLYTGNSIVRSLIEDVFCFHVVRFSTSEIYRSAQLLKSSK